MKTVTKSVSQEKSSSEIGVIYQSDRNKTVGFLLISELCVIKCVTKESFCCKEGKIQMCLCACYHASLVRVKNKITREAKVYIYIYFFSQVKHKATGLFRACCQDQSRNSLHNTKQGREATLHTSCQGHISHRAMNCWEYSCVFDNYVSIHR